MTTEEIVTQQIDAYNRRDLEANMVLFSENFKIINFSDGSILIDGKDACRKMYSDLFLNSPKLFAEVVSRIDFHNKVVLHEYIYGRNGSTEKMEQLIVFEVHDNKIEKIVRF
jgi:hypothetical protein